jgi:NADH:ubiquinone oxidoreductase subunit F (NADH-binding)
MTALATRLLDAPPAAALPHVSLAELLDLVEAAGVTGRGGAGFPTATKIRAVAGARGLVLVGNAMEGEPLSSKDAVLLGRAPHLVAEGLAILGRALGADRRVVGVGQHIDTTGLTRAATPYGVEVVTVPGGFVAGQESALARGLSGAPAIPADPSVRVHVRGVEGRPTLVLNVETLAHVALVARFGTTAVDTALFTLSGAVERPGVVEASWTCSLRDVVDRGRPRPLRAVLVGGYHGTWLSDAELDVPLTDVSIGAGVLHALGTETCPLGVVSDIAGYLAEESAGQCGPCVNALPAIADTVRRLAEGPLDGRLPAEVARLCALAEGRGACAHPDGTVRMVLSAMRVFADEVDLHLSGRCSR